MLTCCPNSFTEDRIAGPEPGPQKILYTHLAPIPFQLFYFHTFLPIKVILHFLRFWPQEGLEVAYLGLLLLKESDITILQWPWHI